MILNCWETNVFLSVHSSKQKNQVSRWMMEVWWFLFWSLISPLYANISRIRFWWEGWSGSNADIGGTVDLIMPWNATTSYRCLLTGPITLVLIPRTPILFDFLYDFNRSWRGRGIVQLGVLHLLPWLWGRGYSSYFAHWLCSQSSNFSVHWKYFIRYLWDSLGSGWRHALYRRICYSSKSFLLGIY